LQGSHSHPVPRHPDGRSTAVPAHPTRQGNGELRRATAHRTARTRAAGADSRTGSRAQARANTTTPGVLARWPRIGARIRRDCTVMPPSTGIRVVLGHGDLEAADRSGIDDARRITGARRRVEQGQQVTRAEEDSLDVQVHHLVETRLRGLGKRRAPRGSRVVHQHVTCRFTPGDLPHDGGPTCDELWRRNPIGYRSHRLEAVSL